VKKIYVCSGFSSNKSAEHSELRTVNCCINQVVHCVNYSRNSVYSKSLKNIKWWMTECKEKVYSLLNLKKQGHSKDITAVDRKI